MKILIADDNDLERQYLTLLLERHKHEVVAVSDGTFAFEYACKNPGGVDLIITDLRMPLMTGLDLVAAIRGLNPEARIWLTSGHLREETMRIAKSLGAERVVWKTHLELALSEEGIIPKRDT